MVYNIVLKARIHKMGGLISNERKNKHIVVVSAVVVVVVVVGSTTASNIPILPVGFLQYPFLSDLRISFAFHFLKQWFSTFLIWTSPTWWDDNLAATLVIIYWQTNANFSNSLHQHTSNATQRGHCIQVENHCFNGRVEKCTFLRILYDYLLPSSVSSKTQRSVQEMYFLGQNMDRLTLFRNKYWTIKCLLKRDKIIVWYEREVIVKLGE